MKLVFLLFEYFPFGGLQRDCIRTALVCAGRGHEVQVLTRSWDGEQPDGIQIRLFGARGWTNIARNQNWIAQIQPVLRSGDFHAVIGFNKMPGLDVYFGADPCFVDKVRRGKPFWYGWLPRFVHYAAMEKAVFGKGQHTQILQLTPAEIPIYKRIYGTEDRFHLLPPMAPRYEFSSEEQRDCRRLLRLEQGWKPGDSVLLFVGSDFRRKGLDRILAGFAALEPAVRRQTQLAVIGQCEPGRFGLMAKRLGLQERVHFLGGRKDVPEWMLAADVLVHPAYVETAGAVLVEALTRGLPVVTTQVCGYAHHIQKSGAGIALEEPFDPHAFQRHLSDLLTSEDKRRELARRALKYARTEDLYGCHEKAADVIESVARNKTEVLARHS